MNIGMRYLALLALAVAPVAAQAADVVIPDPNYISGRTTAFAVKAVIEEALGLEVEMITTTAVPVIFEAMARGNGEIDIWTETWLPNQSGMTSKYVDEEKTVTMSEKSFEALNGYCVTKVAVEQHGHGCAFGHGGGALCGHRHSDWRLVWTQSTRLCRAPSRA